MNQSKISIIKQYIMLALVVTVVLAIYLMLNRAQAQSFISYDKDKAVDPFIYNLLQNSETGGESLFRFCEYNLQNITIYVIKRITHNSIAAINVYYVLSFFFIAFAMFWCMGKFHLSKGITVYVSVFAAFIPYHIDRGEGQIITSSFFMVPLFLGALYELIYVEDDKVLHKGYVVLMILAPFIDIRLSVMMLLMIIILIINRGSVSVAQRISVYGVPMLASTVIVSLLTGIFKVNSLGESIELARDEGLRLCDMLMPLRYHIVRRLSDFRVEYDVTFQASGESGLNSMGILLAVFFVFGLFSLFFIKNLDKRILWMSWMNIVIILISNTRGFNLIFEYFGIHILYWNRMAIMILVNSIAIMGIAADKLLLTVKDTMKLRIVRGMYAAVGMMGFAELLLRQNMDIF